MHRLYANENFPRQVADALKKLGHDVLTTMEAENANNAMTDEDVLAFATQDKRAVITLDRRDFIRLHNTHPAHAGIIVCTQDPDIIEQASRIHQTILKYETLNGCLIRINKPASPASPDAVISPKSQRGPKRKIL